MDKEYRVVVGEMLIAGYGIQDDWMLDDGFDEPFKRVERPLKE